MMCHGGRRRGQSLIETAMFVPVLVLLLIGMAEFARVTYVYYTLHKKLYTLARYLGTQQGAVLCDDGDAVVQSAKSYAITGNTDGSAESTLAGLTAAMIQVRLERYDAETATLGQCECSISGCDSSQGGTAPDYIVVTIPDGFPIRLNVPYLVSDPILFRPTVRVPYGGT
jgi:hypothetical protein